VVWVTFAPDGKSLASAAHDGTVRLWECATGKERCVLQGHKGWVRCAAFAPDGKTIASVGQDPTVRIWDVVTGKELHKLEGHSGIVWTVAFSPDGKTLATGCDDRTIRLWDMAGLHAAKANAAELTRTELQSLGNDLTSPDAERAYRAMGKLVQSSGHSTPFLQQLLLKKNKTGPAEPKRVAKLIADLDADAFRVRDEAAQELAKLGAAVRPALLKALEETTSTEAGYRLRSLLQRLEGLSTDDLRANRGVEILERVGNADARKALNALAKDGPDDRLRADAKASLKRLAHWSH